MPDFKSFLLPPEKPNQEQPNKKRSSKWKAAAAGAMMLGAVALESGLSTKSADAAQKPKRPVVAETFKATNQYLEDIGNFNNQYDDWEPSDHATALELYQDGKKIELSPYFKNLDYKAKAEFLHRHAYTLYQYTKARLEETDSVHTKELEEIAQNIQECKKKFEQAIIIEKEAQKGIDENRERSFMALIELGRDMVYQGIKLEAERPELKKYVDEIKKEGIESIGRAFKIDSNPKYLGDGFFLFPKELKNERMRMVVGLAKQKRQIPLNISEDEAAKKMSSIHCDVAREVVPWANRVVENSKATSEEKTFVRKLEEFKIITRVKDRYKTGKAASLILSTPDPEALLRVMAQKVARDNPEYIDQARSKYQQLPAEDRNLFEEYMTKIHPDASERFTVEYFFVFKHQIGNWQERAKETLGQ